MLFGAAIQRWRTRVLGLRRLPADGPWAERARIPMVYGFSEHVVPRPVDWGEQIAVTGWWLPGWPGWEPPDRLRRFVEDGDPPVYIGFGSMPVPDAAALTATLVEGVRLSGRRAVLNAGWAGLGGDLPATILGVDEAPFDWLFPRVAAVIHHGGSGSVGFGLTHGRPSQIVPFGFDQFFWGDRIRALGVGPAPLAINRLTPQRLADSITRLTLDPRMHERAAMLGERLRAEDGPALAAARIEALAA
jgi:sterol 3beta-glucosyltransferase